MRLAFVAAILIGWSAAALATDWRADIDCRPAGDGPVFDCTIRLTDARTRTPISGAQFTVGADMPSMPMAHNIRPAPAVPTTEPGVYRAPLALDMYGTWTVKLVISRPVHDQIRKTIELFDGTDKR